MSGVYQEHLMHKQTDLEYFVERDNLLRLDMIYFWIMIIPRIMYTNNVTH